MISLVFLFSPIFSAEKDRLAVMDVADEAKLFNKTTIANVTDYIFTKLQGTKIYWMVPKADRDTALEQAIEETVKGSRRECVDEKCQLSLVAQLQANFLINTKIKKLYEGTCNISISKFDVEKRAGVDSWATDFNCSEKGLFEAINGFNFDGKRKGSSFQPGKIGETVEDWEVGDGEEIIVKFESDPSDAIVLVDGRIVCQKTPCSKMVTMGKHTVTIQKENYLPNERSYDIKKGQLINAKLEPDFGWLTVSSPVEIDVILDGQRIGKTPVNKRIISPGGHQVETDDDCFYKTGEKFQIRRGENKTISLDLKARESAIKVTAGDDKGNDLEADVFVDGKNVGTAPGTFKIPMCSKEVAVKTKKGEFKQKLILQEKKVTTIDAL
ncbi:MAG TPA: PEGA domain-containing protein, partial [bacterium]|nr:PEGA domain-containing protein [bacterium]